MKRNLQQNYDAIGAKPDAEPRHVCVGDVLQESQVDTWYLVARSAPGYVALIDIHTGDYRIPPVPVQDETALTQREVTQALWATDSGNISSFRLVGRARDVLTVREPGE